ncbi:MAG: helix-turn-helix transcriptional regulator [Actinomycetota bacterium]
MGIRQRTPHLIGREVPLRALGEARADVGTEGTLVLVSGEAGIGKTRLLDEFAARADDVLVARGGCVDGVAYAPWTDALWWLLEKNAAAFDGLTDRTRARLGRLVAHLATDEPVTDKEDGQQQLFEAVVQLLAHTAEQSPLALVVDDVHWIDPASSELLRYVAGNLRRVPILLIAAYRPEDAASERELISQLGRLARHRIALEGLNEDAAAEMGAYLLGGGAARATDLERIVRDADGNPLFVEELVAAVDDIRVPHTLRDLMLMRFESLDEDARQLVRTAALIGPRAPRAWLTGASGLSDSRARAAARAAVDAGVLLADDDGRGYAFRHDLLREPVLDDLVPDERVELHRAIAAALTEKRAVGVDRIAELARHWDAGEDAEPALRWLVAAARGAEESYAFEAAAVAYERALSWWDEVAEPEQVADVDHAGLLLAAAHAAAFAGHIDRAADLGRSGLEEAFALDPGRGVDAAGRVYPLLWTADRAGELFEFANSALVPVLDRADPQARARFLVNTVEYQLGRDTPAETRATASRMLEAVRDIDDPALEAHAHSVMAHCYEVFGEVELVDTEYERATEIARAAQEHSTLALLLYNRAAAHLSIPRLADGVLALHEVDTLIERYGLRRYLVPARSLRAFITCLQGALDEATTAFTSVEDVFAEGYDAWFRAQVAGLVRLFAGDHDAALATLEADTVGVPELTDSEFAVEIATLRADAYAWKGDRERARRAIDEGQALLERFSEIFCHGWLAMVAIRIEADAAVAATAARQLDAIEAAQARAATILTSWHAAVEKLHQLYPLAQAYALAVDAEMARLNGDDAAAAARRAAEAFNDISIPYFSTYFRWREAEAVLAGGDEPGGTDLLQRARAATRLHGFSGIDAAISALARTYQLRLGPGRTTVDGDVPLSSRELEVLRLIVEGRSNPEIADQLCVSRHTARAHVSNVLRKLDVSSRVEAVSEAHRRGLT